MKGKRGQFAVVVSALALFVSLSLPVRAQVAGAIVTGAVTDAQGGAVANAKVSARNVQTSVVTETTTNVGGAYSILNLIPSDYEISASATGFSTSVAKVTLTVGAKQEMNFSLTVGQVTQEVQVTAAVPAVELASSTLSGNIESTEVRELPLNGRDWATLATLEPGVSKVQAHPTGTQASRGLGIQMTIDGGRPTQNSYRLDGALVNDYSNAGPGSVLGQNLGVDAVQEFSVLTSNYSAEYGFTSGGVINAITRSGTNTLHGTAFDFLRNDKFDAPNYFNNANNLPKQHLVQNQFGASAGWRILKDKLFLFGDYEGVRQSKGTALTQFTISDAVRAGRVTNLSNGVVSVVPIDPYIQKYLGFYPEPVGPANCTGCNANVGPYDWEAVQHTTENFFTVRADQKLSSKDSLFETFVRDPSNYTLPQALNQVFVDFFAYREAGVIEETHVFSAALANTVRIGLDKTNGKTNNYYGFASQAINPLAADTSLNEIPSQGNAHGQPTVNLASTGINNPPGLLWGGTHQDLYNQIFQVYDDAFITRGKHGLKVGFEFLGQQNDTIAINNINGSATFTAGLATTVAKTDCTKGGGGIEPSCGAFVNFLSNQPRTAVTPADLTASNKHYVRDKVFGAYVQDDWRLRSNLTVNLGLRYEMQTNPVEKHGEVAYLVAPNGPSTNLRNSFYTRNPTLKNFEPRIGFSWDPFHNGKTAVRGGVGIFDSLPGPYINALYNATTAPFLGTFGTVGPPGTASPAQGVFPYGIPALLAAPKPTQVPWAYTDANIQRNYVEQWNFNIQRQLASSTTIVVAYAGSHGVHQPFLTEGANSVQPVNLGNPIPGVGYYWPIPWSNSLPSAQQQASLYNPFIQVCRCIYWQGTSSYNSLQLKLDQRVFHGFQVEGSFTWSKSIDDTSGSAAADTFSNEWNATPPYDLRLIRGLSSYDVGRNFVVNALYNAPTPKVLGAVGEHLLGGWQLGVIAQASDGIPIMPSMGMETPDMLGEIIQTLNPPNVISGCQIINSRNVAHYLNSACFSMVPQTATNTPYCDTARAATMGAPGFCPNIRGNLARNSVIGPGLADVDFSVVKNNRITRISESFNVQFRAEFFNALNRANFAPPTLSPNTGGGAMEAILNSGQPNSQFGQLTATQVPNRQIQLALKLIW
jgi:carboxypeptidase family protein/TonB-dependent receptor-like protein